VGDLSARQLSVSKSEAMRVRTKRFGGSIVRFFVSLDKKKEELRVLGKQLLRAGTSVGANYREASRARSESEFVAKIELCVQEADEKQYWLELLRDDCGLKSEALEKLWTEADELICIFVTMSKNTKQRRQG
jgi:four helix bundle protein